MAIYIRANAEARRLLDPRDEPIFFWPALHDCHAIDRRHPSGRYSRLRANAAFRSSQTARRFSSVYDRNRYAGWKVGITGNPR